MSKMGFTKVDNSLLEKLCFCKLTDRQKRIVLFVIRLSFGCHKPSVKIRMSDLCLIGLDKSDRSSEIKKLEDLKVLIRQPQGDILKINPRLEEWCVPLYRDYDDDRYRDLLGRSLAKHQPNRWQNTNMEVGKTPTMNDKRASNRQQETGLKERLKKINIGSNYLPSRTNIEAKKLSHPYHSDNFGGISLRFEGTSNPTNSDNFLQS